MEKTEHMQNLLKKIQKGKEMNNLLSQFFEKSTQVQRLVGLETTRELKEDEVTLLNESITELESLLEKIKTKRKEA
jgi:hypothetical protein